MQHIGLVSGNTAVISSLKQLGTILAKVSVPA
jgi:hypothetical protein